MDLPKILNLCGVVAMKRKRVLWIVIACVVVMLLFVAVLSWPKQYMASQTQTGITYIDMPFEQVRRILTRTEATPEILKHSKTGDLVEYTWLHRGLGSGTLSLELHFVAKAKLKVQTADEDYVGSHLIELQQDVEVKEDFVDSRVELTK